jgi:DNA polymerase-1
MCFSDPSRRYFRHDLFKGYKNKNSTKPPDFDACKTVLQSGYISRELPGLEADDVMGILSGSIKDCVLVSDDKDLLTIVGEHFNVKKHEHGSPYETRWITPFLADYHWYGQMMTGDGADTYPGCKGMGPIKVEQFLQGKGRLPTWPEIVEQFVLAGMTHDDALTQARLARILRPGDYDIANKKVILWQPTLDEKNAAELAAVLSGDSQASSPDPTSSTNSARGKTVGSRTKGKRKSRSAPTSEPASLPAS